MSSKTISTGKLGEDIVTRYLLGKGYDIVERNYRSGYGEIDIIAQDLDTFVFIEVKTVSREMSLEEVSRETYRPEDNLHHKKIRQVVLTAEKYIHSKKVDRDWRIDGVSVELSMSDKRANIRHLKSIV